MARKLDELAMGNKIMQDGTFGKTLVLMVDGWPDGHPGMADVEGTEDKGA